jgi:hypothetical protein
MSTNLIIDKGARQALENLARFANDPAALYDPYVSRFSPDECEEYALHINGYRVSYYIKKGYPGELFRCITVRTPVPGKVPNPTIVFTLASLLGFEGGVECDNLTYYPGRSWRYEADPEESVAWVVQLLGSEHDV